MIWILMFLSLMPSVIPDNFVHIGKNEYGYEEFLSLKDSTIFVYIPEGSFIMGNEDKYNDGDESPQHQVYLKGFFISKYEITNRQYKKFCTETGHRYPEDPGFDEMKDYFNNYPDCPVVNVSYYDALKYCEWAGYDLPTEAQWEKASRGDDKRMYPWGNHFPYWHNEYFANYDPGIRDLDGYKYTSPVDTYKNGQSPYGIYNMAGNVWEWCRDIYNEKFYKESPEKNPLCKIPSGKHAKDRVVRGGSFLFFSWNMRCSNRSFYYEMEGWKDLGFRVVKEVK